MHNVSQIIGKVGIFILQFFKPFLYLHDLLFTFFKKRLSGDLHGENFSVILFRETAARRPVVKVIGKTVDLYNIQSLLQPDL